jgi:hypothetical protein
MGPAQAVRARAAARLLPRARGGAFASRNFKVLAQVTTARAWKAGPCDYFLERWSISTPKRFPIVPPTIAKITDADIPQAPPPAAIPTLPRNDPKTTPAAVPTIDQQTSFGRALLISAATTMLRLMICFIGSPLSRGLSQCRVCQMYSRKKKRASLPASMISVWRRSLSDEQPVRFEQRHSAATSAASAPFGSQAATVARSVSTSQRPVLPVSCACTARRARYSSRGIT